MRRSETAATTTCRGNVDPKFLRDTASLPNRPLTLRERDFPEHNSIFVNRIHDFEVRDQKSLSARTAAFVPSAETWQRAHLLTILPRKRGLCSQHQSPQRDAND